MLLNELSLFKGFWCIIANQYYDIGTIDDL